MTGCGWFNIFLLRAKWCQCELLQSFLNIRMWN